MNQASSFGRSYTSSDTPVYAARVRFSTTLGTGNVSAMGWPTYITSGIVPWRPSPVKLIAKKKERILGQSQSTLL